MRFDHWCGKHPVPLWIRLALVCLLAATTPALAQGVVDLCDCASDAGLRPFRRPLIHGPTPPGTTGCASACESGAIVLALPADGVLRFSSFTSLAARSRSASDPNAANTPVTLLVAGDVVLRRPHAAGRWRSPVMERAAAVPAASAPADSAALAHCGVAAVTGRRWVWVDSRLAATARDPAVDGAPQRQFEAIGGTFTGTAELQPLMGGSGGGGGSGFGFEPACNGGGGGGGGGALLIKANGQYRDREFSDRGRRRSRAVNRAIAAARKAAPAVQAARSGWWRARSPRPARRA